MTQHRRLGSLSYHVRRASRAQLPVVDMQLRPRGLFRTISRVDGVGKSMMVLSVSGGAVCNVDGVVVDGDICWSGQVQ